jgi:hypothetical protein
MDKSITAEWARKTASEILDKHVLNQIKECEMLIVSKLKSNHQNKNSVNIYINLDNLTIKELASRGFGVKKKLPSDPREKIYYEIKW